MPHSEGPSPVIHVESGGGAHGEFRLAGPTHDLGYEPDRFSIKPIMAVPVAVVITGVIAFVFTWLLFSNLFDPKINNPEPIIPAAAEENAAPLNDRFARISSTDPKAKYQQPRLEGLQQTEIYDDEGRAITAEYTTTRPKKEGNSPRYHAEDLRPGPEMDDAIKQLIGSKLLTARNGALPLDINPDWNRPKESNGGNTGQPEPAKPAPKKKADDGKGGEPEKK
jgi:nitrogen fixation-related uncharacterized protein